MSKDDMVDIVPAEGIMFIKRKEQLCMVVAYKKDNNYIAISIPVQAVLEHLEKDGYIINIPEKPKDKMVV